MAIATVAGEAFEVMHDYEREGEQRCQMIAETTQD
jgi:hypothetical protein